MKIMIIGATSAIAAACARRWAEQGAAFFLVARNAERLAESARDLSARGAPAVTTHQADLADADGHAALLAAGLAALGSFDVVLIAHGTLPDQARCEADAELALREFTTNGLSVIALLTRVANQMAQQRAGTLAVISSVAGDRGRPSNYLYGSAKAAVSAFCEGLRARMFKLGVHVLTIKPGFVATPMTSGLAMPGPLVASVDRVADDIVRAVARRRDVLYTPWFWAGIMLVIRSIPRALFKRTSL